MNVPVLKRGVVICTVLIVAGITLFLNQEHLRTYLTPNPAKESSEEVAAPVQEPKVLKLSPQARKNLKLVSKPARIVSYWRKLQIPGVLVDRPGKSDQGVTSPAVGVISQIHAFPGDTVGPEEKLFTLTLFSEYLQGTQKELFRSIKETQIIQEQLKRLQPLAKSGAVSGSKIIDLENQILRQQAVVQGHRQDLLTRGLKPEHITQISNGNFVSKIDIVAPSQIDTYQQPVKERSDVEKGKKKETDKFAFEVQELNIELGQQVQAGQLLVTLANHSTLYIEGHAFKREAPYLETAVQQGWNISVEFAEDYPDRWEKQEQQFQIRYLSNMIDSDSRTFDFFIPLTNQSHSYHKEGRSFVVWRFRPGQRVRLHVPVEELKDVIVLPSEAVVNEGPESFVFQQNGDLFNRIPVHVLHKDRLDTVIANDGSITPGLYFAQSAAASLNRVLKAQAASGMQANVHVHADGTVHASH